LKETVKPSTGRGGERRNDYPRARKEKKAKASEIEDKGGYGFSPREGKRGYRHASKK